MKNENFQLAVKIGGLALFLSTAASLYFLLRYREVYRDATRLETVMQQQGPGIAMRQQAIEGVLREFASQAAKDEGLAEIFNRYRPANTNSVGQVQK